MITIILVVGGARILGIIDFPGPSTSQVQKVSTVRMDNHEQVLMLRRFGHCQPSMF